MQVYWLLKQVVHIITIELQDVNILTPSTLNHLHEALYCDFWAFRNLYAIHCSPKQTQLLSGHHLLIVSLRALGQKKQMFKADYPIHLRAYVSLVESGKHFVNFYIGLLRISQDSN
jgi:DNA polymerase III psi subunit